ncbi:MAG: hypothetical protein ACYCYK_07825 [Candidatus Dormibacteria bacterium]
MGLLARWLLSRRWQESRLRQDAQAMVLLLGSLFGHQPPHIEPMPTVIGTPWEGEDGGRKSTVAEPARSDHLSA